MAAAGLYDFRYCTRCGDIDLLDRVTRLCPSCSVMAVAKRTMAPHYRALGQTKQPWRPSVLHRRLAGHAVLLSLSFWICCSFLPALAAMGGFTDHLQRMGAPGLVGLSLVLDLFAVVAGWAARAIWGR